MSTIITPEITTERTAVIVYLLARGRKFRTAEVAALCGVTRRGAYALMARISRVVPLTFENGEWAEFRPDEEAEEAEEGQRYECKRHRC